MGVVIFLVALIARITATQVGAGLTGRVGNDPATYYADSVGLLSGRLPYRDFVMVHPPVIAIVETPFALFGRLTTDHAGFIAANIAFILLGAANSVLVARLAQKYGAGRVGALVAGLIYAVWIGSVGTEFGARLETIGNTFFLVALLRLADRRGETAWTRSTLVTGALLALPISVKIWWVLPVLVVLAAELLGDRERRRQVPALLTGGALITVLVNGPFFLAAPGAMWSQVVAAQLGRPRLSGSFGHRLAAITTGGAGSTVAIGAIVVLIGAAMVIAWRAGHRMIVTLLGIQTVLLFVTPSYFNFYSDFLAVPLAVTVGIAAGARRRIGLGPVLATALVAIFAGTTITTLARDPQFSTPIVGQDELVEQASEYHCVVAASPMDLIVANALARSFQPGCHNIVDLCGWELTHHDPTGSAAMKANLRDYLHSGDAFIIGKVRPAVGYETWRSVTRGLRGGRVGDYWMYRAPGQPVPTGEAAPPR